ncbi:MAG: hypothetical protein WCP77_04840, partial [Roseococcus sp.]
MPQLAPPLGHAPASAGIRVGRLPRAPLLIAGLMALLWIGPFQLHPPIGWVDPGLYIYWFRAPAENFLLRGADYHGARLPFVLLGNLLYRLFDVVTAQALLVSLFQICGLVAIHAVAATVLRGFAARAAVTALVGLNPIWLAAMMRGYVDGPAMALGLAALAVLLRSHGLAGHAAAGALLAACFFTHPFAGGLAGLSLGAALMALAPGWRAWLLRTAMMAAGAFSLLCLAGVLAMGIGLPFFFLGMALPRVQQAVGVVGATLFHVPVSAWIGEAQRVALYPLALVLAGVGLWTSRGAGRAERALAFAALAPIAALLASLPLWSGFVLQFNFYASYVWLSLVPGLVLLARGMEGADLRPWVPLMALIAGAATLVLALFLPLEARDLPALGLTAWAATGLAISAGMGLLLAGRAGGAFVAIAVAIGIGGAATKDTATALRLPDGPSFAAQQRGLAAFDDFLRQTGGTQGRYLIWVGREGLTAARSLGPGEFHALRFAGTEIRLNALDSLAASLGWDVVSLGFAMPGFSDGLALSRLAALGSEPTPLVLLCAEQAGCAEGIAALAELGVEAELSAIRVFDIPGMPRFAAQRTRVSVPAREAVPSTAQVEAVLAWVARVDGMPGSAALTSVERAARHPPGPYGLAPRVLRLSCQTQGASRLCETQ